MVKLSCAKQGLSLHGTTSIVRRCRLDDIDSSEGKSNNNYFSKKIVQSFFSNEIKMPKFGIILKNS